MRPTLTWLTDHRFGLGWPCGSCPTSGRRQPSASSADEAPGQLGESHGLPTKRRPYQPGDPRMTWAVPTNVCLPTRASRPDTQRTNDGFPRPCGSCPQCPPGGAHRYATRSRTAQGTYHAAHARYAAISVCSSAIIAEIGIAGLYVSCVWPVGITTIPPTPAENEDA